MIHSLQHPNTAGEYLIIHLLSLSSEIISQGGSTLGKLPSLLLWGLGISHFFRILLRIMRLIYWNTLDHIDQISINILYACKEKNKQMFDKLFLPSNHLSFQLHRFISFFILIRVFSFLITFKSPLHHCHFHSPTFTFSPLGKPPVPPPPWAGSGSYWKKVRVSNLSIISTSTPSCSHYLHFLVFLTSSSQSLTSPSYIPH